MKLEVNPLAIEWYKKELNLKPNDSIKLYGKVYGAIDGFSIAIEKSEPSRPFFTKELEGIHFFIETNDEWFFIDKNVRIEFDPELKEPKYILEVQ